MAVAVNLDTDGLRIGDGHGALVIHRCAVAGDINTVTAAADIQIAVLNHLPVIASNFRTGGILAVNGGFAVVVCRGVITVNLRAGATVGDGALAFVVNNRRSPSTGYRWTPDR